MDRLTEIRRPIEDELKAYRRLFEETLITENPLLQMALNHLLKRQGKMMRPMLVLLAAKYVGEVNDAVLHAAVSLELLHTASLVHDDVVDESDRRRGQKSVNALLDNKAAVLVGDFLLSKALYHAAATGSQQVVTWVSELGQILSDGELLQLANLDKTEISEADYFEVIRKKTASLFETCAKAGAMLAKGREEDIDNMSKYGEYVGMCFQMRDDIFDYDANHDVGKPSGNDMKEGKLTLPVIHSLIEKDDKKMFTLALRVRRGEATEDEIARLVDLAWQGGGIAYAETTMQQYSQQALETLNYKKDRESTIADSLSQYVAFVADRQV